MENKLIAIIILFLVSISIVSALPDLVIEDIDFFKGKILIEPDENGTHFKTGDRFYAKPVIRNIGDTASTGFHFTTYLDGKWYSLITIGGLEPNQTHNTRYVPSGSSMPFGDGNHNVTMYVNEPDFNLDYLYHPTINESNYTNNIYTEVLYSDDQPTNNPPEITFVDMENHVIEGEILEIEFGVHDPNGEFDIAEFGIKLDNETISTGTTYFEWEPNASHIGDHNMTFYVIDHTAGATDEVIVDIEVLHILENNEIDDIAIPLYTYFDLNDNAPFNLTIDEFTFIGGTMPSLFFYADRYTEDEMVGDEYMDENADLTEEEARASLELTYGSTSDPFYCASEFFLPIYPTTATGYENTLVGHFCFLENICNFLSTGNSECSDPYAAQIYDHSPKINPSIPYISSQTFSVIARDVNNDAITIKWYIDDELNETDQFNSGSDGGKADFTFVGSESLVGEHTIRVEIADEYDTPDADTFNFMTTYEWIILVTN